MNEPAMIEMLSAVQPWFENAGRTGGLLGGGIGILAGVYGSVAGMCAPRGKAKRLVFGLHWFTLLLGLGLLVGAITAMVRGQPYGVWFALLLPGALLTVLMIIFTPMLKLRYRQAEHRKLNAEEFRRG